MHFPHYFLLCARDFSEDFSVSKYCGFVAGGKDQMQLSSGSHCFFLWPLGSSFLQDCLQKKKKKVTCWINKRKEIMKTSSFSFICLSAAQQHRGQQSQCPRQGESRLKSEWVETPRTCVFCSTLGEKRLVAPGNMTVKLKGTRLHDCPCISSSTGRFSPWAA